MTVGDEVDVIIMIVCDALIDLNSEFEFFTKNFWQQPHNSCQEEFILVAIQTSDLGKVSPNKVLNT